MFFQLGRPFIFTAHARQYHCNVQRPKGFPLKKQPPLRHSRLKHPAASKVFVEFLEFAELVYDVCSSGFEQRHDIFHDFNSAVCGLVI